MRTKLRKILMEEFPYHCDTHYDHVEKRLILWAEKARDKYLVDMARGKGYGLN